MSDKKYILTNDTVYINRYRNGEYVKVPLYRIQAVRDFGDVKKGDKGGFVEHDENLSHRGDCWIYDEAAVYDEAQIKGNAKVSNRAQVYGYAQVYGDAKVHDNARMNGESFVYDEDVTDQRYYDYRY